MSIEYSTKDFRSNNYCTWLCSLISVMGFKARSGRLVTPGVGCTDTVEPVLEASFSLALLTQGLPSYDILAPTIC